MPGFHPSGAYSDAHARRGGPTGGLKRSSGLGGYTSAMVERDLDIDPPELEDAVNEWVKRWAPRVTVLSRQEQCPECGNLTIRVRCPAEAIDQLPAGVVVIHDAPDTRRLRDMARALLRER